MLAEIEKTDDFSSSVLSKVKRDNWDAMCQDTGGLHLKQWRTASSIEPSFPDDEIENGLTLAELYAALASLELAQMAVRGDGTLSVLGLIQDRFKQ